MTLTAPQALHGAQTVSIIIHGVGDHSETDIIEEAERHLATIATDEVHTSRYELLNFPRPSGATGHTQSALEIQTQGKKHFILPIVWSRFRMRAVKWADKLGAISGMQILTVAAPALFILFLDVIRCIPKARGFWKLGVGCISLLLPVLAGLLWWAVFYLVVHLPFWFDTVGIKGGHWYGPLIVIGATFMIGVLLKRSMPLFDFVGDVACYIGRDNIRNELEETISQIIQNVSEWAPDAQILVVGHSLGTVLVTHSIFHLPQGHTSTGRTILLTLGSPLRLISRVFPAISTPDDLLEKYVQTGLVSFWANLWRDGDFIGRALQITHQTYFAETSLGKGPHWNIWGDKRLWGKVGDILKAKEGGSLDMIRDAWEPLPLNNQETRELSVHQRNLAKRKWWPITILVFIALSLKMKRAFWSPWTFNESAWNLAALRACWIIGFFTLVFHFWLVSISLEPRVTDREWLGDLRLMVWVCSITGLIALAAASGMMFFDGFLKFW